MVISSHISIILLLASILDVWPQPLLLWSLTFGSTTFKMASIDVMTRDFTV